MGTGVMVLAVVLILAAFIGAGILLSVYMAKRAGRGAGPLAGLTLPGEKQAPTQEGIELIKADDALREARQELDFASASLPEDQLSGARAALTQAEAKIHEGFALKQQLDSATVAAAGKPKLTEQIYLLSSQAQQIISEQLAQVGQLTSTATSLTGTAQQLTAALDAIDERATAARPQAAALAAEFGDKAAEGAAARLDQAQELTQLARRALASALGKAEAGDVAGAQVPLRAAQTAQARADGLVGGVEHAPDDLLAAQLSLSSTLEQAQAEVKAITDGSHAQDGAPATALAALNELIATLPASGKSADPLTDLETLRAAQARLGQATGSVGKAQMTPDQARSALAGTLMAARQHLAQVDQAVATNARRVSAEARVKAGQAREMIGRASALAASDPVGAIDLAWQADQAAAAAEKAL